MQNKLCHRSASLSLPIDSWPVYFGFLSCLRVVCGRRRAPWGQGQAPSSQAALGGLRQPDPRSALPWASWEPVRSARGNSAGTGVRRGSVGMRMWGSLPLPVVTIKTPQGQKPRAQGLLTELLSPVSGACDSNGELQTAHRLGGEGPGADVWTDHQRKTQVPQKVTPATQGPGHWV